jgi:glycosyltransferase involved in cell wall biosynthesis
MRHQCTSGVNSPIVFIDDAHTFGGAQIALAWAIRAILRNTNERIVCVCTDRTRKAIQEIAGESRKLEFIECPGALPLNFVSFPFRLPMFLGILLRLRRLKVRAWWLNLSGIEFCLASLLILRTLGEVPRAWLHNAEHFTFFSKNSSWARRSLGWIRDRVADGCLFSLYPLIVTPSRSTANQVQVRIGRTTCPLVGHLYFPAVGESHPPTASSPAGDVGSVDPPIAIWMIGRIEYGQKNNLAALEAMEFLIRDGSNVTLTMVGDGPDMENFEARVHCLGLADKVTFLGWKRNPWETIPSDALVMIPSFYESASLVAIEAMNKGVRLAVSPIPVFDEWIPNVLIAEDFSPRAFAKKILEVYSLSNDELFALYAAALTIFSDAAFVQRFTAYTDEDC